MYWKIYNTASNTIVEFGYGDDLNGIGIMYTMDLSASVTARAICETVKSQGGFPLFEIPGFPFAAYNSASPTSWEIAQLAISTFALLSGHL